MTTVEVVTLLVAGAAAAAAWLSAVSSRRSADAASKTGKAAERSAGSAERMVAAAVRAEEERVIESLSPLLAHDVKIHEVHMLLETLSEPFRSRRDEILARAIVGAGTVALALDDPAFRRNFAKCAEMLDRISKGQDLFGERPAGTVT